MKKLLVLTALCLLNILNAQFQDAKSFVEFSKKNLTEQKVILKKGGWIQEPTAEIKNKPNAAFKVKSISQFLLKSKSGDYYVSLKSVQMPAGLIKETKLSFPQEQGLILSDWIVELMRSGYNLSQINAYTMSAIGNDYTLMIKMMPSDGYTEPISEISYMAH